MITQQQAAAELVARIDAQRSLEKCIGILAPDTIPAKHHKLLISKLEGVDRGEIPRLMVMMPPGSAKALALDTPIPTPSGWSTMGRLRVGDWVFDDQGQPCMIIRKSEVFHERPVYEVQTDCGDRIIADEDHEWLVRLCGKRPVFKLKTSKQLARRRTKRPMVCHASALRLPSAALPLDPYLLGAWLGDGTTSSGSITSGDRDRPWMRAEIERLGYETRNRSVSNRFGVADIRSGLVALGVLHDPLHKTIGEKHIPAVYMRASISQRRALLQGLIDTDGTVQTNGMVAFCSTNARLASGVAELVRTLGAKASIGESRAILNGKDCGPYWRVYFYLKGAARLPRKAMRTRDGERTPNTYLTVTPAGRADTVCIEVDSLSHLFLCGTSMTPTHNSTYASILFPPWFLGRNPKHSIIGASHAGELAERFGRRVRNLCGSAEFRRIFGFGLSGDNAAAGRWETERGGEYYAVGVDASVTGRRADLGIIDDPVKGRAEADSATTRQRVWDWYKADFWPRLKPGGRIVLILCMTGDTPVLMATGREKPLRDVRRGDDVATYTNGRISTATVLNHASQGSDFVYTIRMKSGITVRANARHPFLVCEDGEEKWRRTDTLKRGNIIRWVTRASGEGLIAPQRDVTSPLRLRASACRIMAKTGGLPACGRLLSTLGLIGRHICAIGTELILQIMSRCFQTRGVFALSAVNHYPLGIRDSSVLTTITTRGRLEGYCAITATSWSERGRQRRHCSERLDTFEITQDEVVAVGISGIEEVFDIQVEGTENFIANGLVSHNTRWHEDDLAGRLLAEQAVGGEQWDVLALPAEAGQDDPLGRAPGELLWPEWFTPAMFAEAKRDVRNWSALYQQQPTPDSGDYFKADWIRWYDRAPDIRTLRTYGASDYAVTSAGGDYTVHGVIGVDPNDDIYLLDWWRDQTDSQQWIEAFLDLMERWQPLMWAEEQGQILRSLGPFIAKRQMERRIYGYRRAFTSSHDKETRAQAIRGRLAMGKVYFPRQSLWATDLVEEMLRFPAGRNDDQVDVLSLIGRMLVSLVHGDDIKHDEPIRGLSEMTYGELDKWQKTRDAGRGRPQRI